MSGLIILPVFIFYVSVSFFILRAIFKKLFPKMNSLKINLSSILIVLIFPFWDLWISRIISTVLNSTLEEYVIIDTSINNNEFKFDSLDKTITTMRISLDDLNTTSKRVSLINSEYPHIQDRVKQFIELTYYYYPRTGDDKKGLVKIFVNKEEMPYTFVKESQARYSTKNGLFIDYFTFFGFKINRYAAKYIDKKTSNAIAMKERYFVSNQYFMDVFRVNYLFWITGASQRPIVGGDPNYVNEYHIPIYRIKDEVFKLRGSHEKN